MDLPALLFYLGTVLVSWCCGFSVDVATPTIFQIRTQSFGSSVAQTRNEVLVGAPLQHGRVNEIGKLYRCTYSSSACTEISIQRPIDAVNMSLGLSLVARDSQILVCGPTVHRACGTNMYLNGYCFLLDQKLQKFQQFPEILPECTTHPTDIVFLIDGSGSVSNQDFERMKWFVSEVIKRLSGRNTRFALAQYSTGFTEHFDFNAPDPSNNVLGITQNRGMTYTATAIRKVVREIFIPRKGSRNGSTKILVVITDGQKNDQLQYWNVVPEAERAGIIRYAIGVGNAFSTQRAREELNAIASEPDNEHVFAVHNFDALKGIQDQLQDKIFAIEGTQFQSSSSFQMEMSQEGFSALLTRDGPVLGAVGAFDWSGGLFLYQNSNRDSSFLNASSTTEEMKNAYLGYSSQAVLLNGRSGLVVGAPRYDYVGKVVLFEKAARSGKWQLTAEAVGEQVGSYFGAALCSVDLDQDTDTDLVLVGAPMYYDAITGGRVYVCHFKQGRLHCTMTLKGEAGHVFSRFGASMAETGDITGDRWMDVAIGAPMENENVGALYIFGGKRTSINPKYLQRIEGLKFSGGFLYFGQAVSGGTDLTGDGLKDIAVGQKGRVLLLRTRPVLHVSVSIEFFPPLIPTSNFQCQEQESLKAEASMAKVCFTVAKAIQDKLGEISSDLYYTLALDHERTKIRATFSSKSVLTTNIQIGLENKCQNHPIELPICIEDTLTPVTLRLNFSLVGKPIAKAPTLQPILSKDSEKNHTALLHFEKNCGTDGKCEDRLEASFNFSGLDIVVVGLTGEFNVTASIQNHGEDSYSTTLGFFYPAGLSYRKVTLPQLSRRVVSVKCHSVTASEEDVSRNTTCNINHPIFYSKAKVIFIATFDVSPDVDLGDTLRIMASANSDNGGNITKDMVHEAELPVKYAVYIIVTAIEESTKYINFTAGQEDASKNMEHRYEVKNLRQRNVPISVTFQIPVKLKGIQVWNVSQVVSSQFAKCVLEKESAGNKDFPVTKDLPLLDCSVASCKIIRCDILSLKTREPLEFRIKGDVGFQWASQIQQKKVVLVSMAQISYDEKKYTQKEGFAQAQVQTMVERIELYNYLPAIIGSAIAGLVLLAVIAAVLYKVGFFKRQYKQMLTEAGAGDEAADPTSQPTPQDLDTSPPSKETVY
ncbi:integrin alpha-X-like isoform X1 [Podarcis lilfordi]|uniref:Integrin alpha-X-like isoform X1 n=2 Tax=Podarcis lilfordi TaxID=74358 RepID=A0AA35L730_9SAUR|nr:integrin alpha-X-like isoform X1 [Podarcis lilfordi]